MELFCIHSETAITLTQIAIDPAMTDFFNICLGVKESLSDDSKDRFWPNPALHARIADGQVEIQKCPRQAGTDPKRTLPTTRLRWAVPLSRFTTCVVDVEHAEGHKEFTANL